MVGALIFTLKTNEVALIAKPFNSLRELSSPASFNVNKTISPLDTDTGVNFIFSFMVPIK